MSLMKFARNCVLLSLSILSVTASADVWVAENTWSQDYERSFADWVNTSVKEDIFSNPQSPWHGIQTDCADAVYTIRIIFAYQNRLPVLWKNTQVSGEMMSEKMTKWDHLSEKARVIAFANHVNKYTGTYTLANDTYPVTVSQKWVRPGSLYLQPKRKPVSYIPSVLTNGHVYIIKEVTAGGSVLYMGSTVPAAVRKLSTRYDNPFAPLKSDSGFRNWKWPQDYHRSSSSIEGYSLEQFSVVDFEDKMVGGAGKIMKWNNWAQGKLMLRASSLDEKLEQALYNVCNQIRDRIGVVQEAQRAKQNNGGRCLSGSTWEDLSTPSRDKRLHEDFEKLRSLSGQKYKNWDMTAVAKHPKACRYEVTSGRNWDLVQFFKWSSGWKTDPNYSVEGRWGLSTKMDCQN